MSETYANQAESGEMFNSTADALAARYQALGMLQKSPLIPTPAGNTNSLSLTPTATTAATAVNTGGNTVQSTSTVPLGIGGLPLQTAGSLTPRAPPAKASGIAGYHSTILARRDM